MAKRPDKDRYCDGDDDLIVERVGRWANDKANIVRRYVTASSAARKGYPQSAYIDVFCGPGRAQVRDDGQFIDGTAVVGFNAAREAKAPFARVEIADLDPRLLQAAETRLRRVGAPVGARAGSAATTLKQIIDTLDPSQLHFAFLDPHNLGTLSFDLFAELARLRRVDIIAHVSVADIQRNTDRYLSPDHGQFDSFAPGWRDSVNQNANIDSIRGEIIRYWKARVERLGLTCAGHHEGVANTKNRELYWLFFFSRHPLAHKLWLEISSAVKEPKFI